LNLILDYCPALHNTELPGSNYSLYDMFTWSQVITELYSHNDMWLRTDVTLRSWWQTCHHRHEGWSLVSMHSGTLHELILFHSIDLYRYMHADETIQVIFLILTKSCTVERATHIIKYSHIAHLNIWKRSSW